MDLVRSVEESSRRKEDLPPFRVGDTVDVHVRITEGDKQRIQLFTGTVIKIRGRKGINASFTVRRIVAGEGVERTFPYHSPVIHTVKVRRAGKVRRAKLYYLRERVGKATRVKERRDATKPTRTKGRKRRGEKEGQPEQVEQPVA